MRYPNTRLRRVTLHADSGTADVTLPADMAIAELLPAVVDLLAAPDGPPSDGQPVGPYRLSTPGQPAFDNHTTLAQNAIRDGTVLVLTRTGAEPPAPRSDDPYQQLSAAVRAATRPWTRRDARSTAALAAVGLAAAAGLVAVPAGPGGPNALLAAAAATAAAVLALQLGATGPVGVTLCCLAVLAAAAAAAAVLGRCSPAMIGAVGAAVSVGLLHFSGRLSIILAGLVGLAYETEPGVDRTAVRGHDVLTGLVVAFAVTATAGALSAAGDPRGVALAAVTGAALLLRARSHSDSCRVGALVLTGTVTVGGAALAATAAAPQLRCWLCAILVVLSCGALFLGHRPTVSPLARRAVELLEYPVLAAVIPLAGWVGGCYDTVRGLNLL